MSEWRDGEPDGDGYYLAAWRRGGTLCVSELWFNPDAPYHWWFSRGYTGLDTRAGIGYACKKEVVAWMPLPDPPESP